VNTSATILPVKAVKAISFDGFSTLFSVFDMSSIEAAVRYLASIGRLVDETELRVTYGILNDQYNCGQLGAFELWQHISEALSLNLRPEEVGRLAVIELEECIKTARPFPGVYETLDVLKSRGTPTAIVSNASEVGRMLEVVLGLDGRVDHFLLSCDVGHTKDRDAFGNPSDIMYLRLAQRLGLRPGEIAIVDDNIDTLQHAKRLGFYTIWAVQGEVHWRCNADDQFGQDATITDLRQVLDLLPLAAAS